MNNLGNLKISIWSEREKMKQKIKTLKLTKDKKELNSTIETILETGTIIQMIENNYYQKLVKLLWMNLKRQNIKWVKSQLMPMK